MATSGKPLDAQTIARIRRNASAYRMSVRKNAREERVCTRTVQKYAPPPDPPDDDDEEEGYGGE